MECVPTVWNDKYLSFRLLRSKITIINHVKYTYVLLAQISSSTYLCALDQPCVLPSVVCCWTVHDDRIDEIKLWRLAYIFLNDGWVSKWIYNRWITITYCTRNWSEINAFIYEETLNLQQKTGYNRSTNTLCNLKRIT